MTDDLQNSQLDREIQGFLAWQADDLHDAPSAREVAAHITSRVGSGAAAWRLSPYLTWIVIAGLLLLGLMGAAIVGANLLRNGPQPRLASIAADTFVWSLTGPMTTPRRDHSATLLSDGRVLVAGGWAVPREGRDARPMSSAELYDPASGSWTATGSMREPHGVSDGHAVLLNDGRVLLIDETTAEIYDPATAAWVHAAPPTTEGSVTKLADGRVLIAGADGCAIYDPALNSWTQTADMLVTRYGHVATLLADGTVLIVGEDEVAPATGVHTAEVYDPQTETWSHAGTIGEPRSHSATLLPDGRVLDKGGPFGGRDEADLYDPNTRSWSGLNIDVPFGDFLGQVVQLDDGSLLFFGVELTVAYDPMLGTWAVAAVQRDGMRSDSTETALRDGRVLVAGGYLQGLSPTRSGSSAELFGPPTR